MRVVQITRTLPAHATVGFYRCRQVAAGEAFEAAVWRLEKAMSLKGSCHCGYMQYSVDRDELSDVANCHCSICRRSTGGTFVTWATVPKGSLQWIDGTPGVYIATENSQRYYCPRCGAQLALYTDLAPHTIDITVSTLDRVDDFPPRREIWVKNKIKWLNLSESLAHENEETL